MRRTSLAGSIPLPLIFLSFSACEAGPGSVASAPNLPEWTAVEELRIGTVEGDGPDQFGQILGLALDQRGLIHVLDFQAQEIRVFAQDGAFVQTIGSEGEGPGELRRAAGMNFGPDGELVVWDPGNRRFTTFDPRGQLLSTVPRRAAGVIYPWGGGFTPDGRFVDWGLDRPGDDVRQGVIGSINHYLAINVDLGDGSIDTLHTFVGERESGAPGTFVPFARGPNLHLSRSGEVWLSDPTSYTLNRLSLSGDTLAAYSFRGEPAAITEREIDSIRTIVSEQPSFPADWDAIPESKQIVRRMFDDGERHLFVLPELAGVRFGTQADVIETSSGEMVAALRFPEPLLQPYPPPMVYGDQVLAAVKDEFDVEYVVLYRIVRP